MDITNFPVDFVTFVVGKHNPIPENCVRYDTFDIEYAVREHRKLYGKVKVCYMANEGDTVYIPLEPK